MAFQFLVGDFFVTFIVLGYELLFCSKAWGCTISIVLVHSIVVLIYVLNILQ